MKGISTIIATIIMVVITIGLISVAYLYMSGLITSRTTQNIQLADAFCRASDKHIIALIKNIGTVSIPDANLNVVLRGTTSARTCNPALPLPAGSTTSCDITTAGVTGPNELRIIGPANAVGGTVNCP
jgi:FlaG/FlaF family flagellin (archaellin)